MRNPRPCGVSYCRQRKCGMPGIGMGNDDLPIHVCAKHWPLLKNNGFEPMTYAELAQRVNRMAEAGMAT